mgnify:CR=1 FL=1
MYATLSFRFNCFITSRPICFDSISETPLLRSFDSILSTIASISSTLMVVFSHALIIPLRTLLRSNGLRVLSFLMTVSGRSSTSSWVVKRLLHFRHSLRLRIIFSVSLLSMTRDSTDWQNGHFIVRYFFLPYMRDCSGPQNILFWNHLLWRKISW